MQQGSSDGHPANPCGGMDAFLVATVEAATIPMFWSKAPKMARLHHHIPQTHLKMVQKRGKERDRERERERESERDRERERERERETRKGKARERGRFSGGPSECNVVAPTAQMVSSSKPSIRSLRSSMMPCTRTSRCCQ